MRRFDEPDALVARRRDARAREREVAHARLAAGKGDDAEAIGAQQDELATGSVAAPVRNAAGSCVASVCLISGIADLSRSEDTLLETIVAVADSLSYSIGWRPRVGQEASAG